MLAAASAAGSIARSCACGRPLLKCPCLLRRVAIAKCVGFRCPLRPAARVNPPRTCCIGFWILFCFKNPMVDTLHFHGSGLVVGPASSKLLARLDAFQSMGAVLHLAIWAFFNWDCLMADFQQQGREKAPAQQKRSRTSSKYYSLFIFPCILFTKPARESDRWKSFPRESKFPILAVFSKFSIISFTCELFSKVYTVCLGILGFLILNIGIY